MSLQQDLMAKWISVIRKSDHIFTWTGDGELAYIAEEAAKATHAVEVGTYLGRSAKVMLDANPNLHLWCVDPGLVDGVFETSRYFLRDEIAQGRCEMIRKYTFEASPMLRHMAGKLDMLWIDGGHSFQDVMTDIKHWLPLLKAGGLACGHDLELNPKNDVTKAVEWCLFDWWTEPVPRVWSYRKRDNDHFRI
jgi:predicted O-methyltransferase YrrM